jgi:prepilin-type N-terminal cleavage/methylation domain-containing protein
MTSTTITPAERGFSLIELLIAIVITLIVTGSIYGLLAQGQNAFRREPEISDRQQQIRLAMDLIQRDITTAGMAMPEWTQVFIPGLDGAGPNNAQGVASDYLEIVGYDGACIPMGLCGDPNANPIQSDALPTCYRGAPPIFAMMRPGFQGSGDAAVIGLATPSGAGDCSAGGEPVDFTIPPPVPPFSSWHLKSSGAVSGPTGFGDIRPVQLVLYRIYEDGVNGIPSLWRSTQGGMNPANVAAGPVDPGAGSDWQLVASGIEDLQVEYRDGNPAPDWDTVPPGIVQNDWTTIVREVKITLSARTTGQQMLAGESISVTGVRAIRGQLTSVTTPRASLAALSSALVPAPQQWN